MNQPPPWPPPGHSTAPSYVPSREAMEAERLAREARERRLANDQLVVTIYRVVGGLGIGVALLMVLINLKSGHNVDAGRIVIRTLLFGGGGVGAFLRGNSIARRHHHHAPLPQAPIPPPTMHTYAAPPFQPMTQTSSQPPPPPPPGQITRWTD